MCGPFMFFFFILSLLAHEVFSLGVQILRYQRCTNETEEIVQLVRFVLLLNFQLVKHVVGIDLAPGGSQKIHSGIRTSRCFFHKLLKNPVQEGKFCLVGMRCSQQPCLKCCCIPLSHPNSCLFDFCSRVGCVISVMGNSTIFQPEVALAVSFLSIQNTTRSKFSTLRPMAAECLDHGDRQDGQIHAR